MSAFTVSYKHINALINYAAAKDVHFHWDIAGQTAHYDPRIVEDAQTLGAILVRENVRSVLARYPQDKPEDFIDWQCGYQYKLATPVSAIQALKACQCLDYQSCETDDWKQTFAYRIVSWIKSAAINALPGYDEAQWEIN